eukprot:GILK01007932.1.p1 GENE.GILK01007932.1~~GILK01007932.1.p1  ORF type:complete len:342 (-),score=64.95 GILK01007932.1:55-1056(-)
MDKATQLKAQQQRWLRDRQQTLEREALQQQIQEQRQGVVMQSQPSVPGNMRDAEEMVNRLTERIAERMKVELREELVRENKMVDTRQENLDAQVSKLLTNELESHTCPVCLEIMMPPDYSPIMLFPCGHTFCTNCVSGVQKKATKKQCPLCRTAITTSAPNVSLQQIIESFSSQREFYRKNEKAKEKPQNGMQAPLVQIDPSKPSETALQYVREFRMLDMRCRVLSNEYEDTKESLRALESRSVAASVGLTQLLQEEQDVVTRLEQIQLELKLVRNHIAEQQRKVNETNEQLDRSRAQLTLIESTIAPLERDREKAKLMVAHYDPTLLSRIDI